MRIRRRAALAVAAVVAAVVAAGSATGCGRGKETVCVGTVFFEAGTPTERLNESARRLRGFGKVTVLDKQAAYENYRSTFKDTPDLEDVLTEDEVPLSVELVTDSRADVLAVNGQKGDPDVRDVTLACGEK